MNGLMEEDQAQPLHYFQNKLGGKQLHWVEDEGTCHLLLVLIRDVAWDLWNPASRLEHKSAP